MSISGLSSRPSLFEKDKFYLTRLDEIRQNEENKARERAKTMCLSTSTDPNMEAVELVEAVVEAFEAASQAAFSDKPKDFQFYVRCSEPKQYALADEIAEVIKGRLGKA